MRLGQGIGQENGQLVDVANQPGTRAAASGGPPNWLALATFAADLHRGGRRWSSISARHYPTFPIDGRPVPAGRTDSERACNSKELVYTASGAAIAAVRAARGA